MDDWIGLYMLRPDRLYDLKLYLLREMDRVIREGKLIDKSSFSILELARAAKISVMSANMVLEGRGVREEVMNLVNSWMVRKNI